MGEWIKEHGTSIPYGKGRAYSIGSRYDDAVYDYADGLIKGP